MSSAQTVWDLLPQLLPLFYVGWAGTYLQFWEGIISIVAKWLAWDPPPAFHKVAATTVDTKFLKDKVVRQKDNPMFCLSFGRQLSVLRSQNGWLQRSQKHTDGKRKHAGGCKIATLVHRPEYLLKRGRIKRDRSPWWTPSGLPMETTVPAYAIAGIFV